MIEQVEDSVYWAVVEAAPDGVLLCDDGGRIRLVNRQAELMFGYAREDLIGHPVETLVPAEARGVHVGHRQRYVDHPSTRPMGSGLHLTAIRRDGSSFPVEVALSVVEATPAGKLIVATVRDVTDRRAIETELADQRTKATVAEDRERIARDLHDTVIQRLFADGLTIQALLNRVEPDVAERLQAVLDDHDDAIREIRTTILGLGRSRAGESGIRRAVIEIIEQSSRILGFRPSVRLDGVLENRLGAQTEGDVLASLREALSNAARHADPTSIEVEISAGPDQLALRVMDNGNGFDPSSVTHGNGLINLRQRAEELG
ncbi:MAG: PAS domain S-box protein, partial [Ilumatobacteraceae bacterium]